MLSFKEDSEIPPERLLQAVWQHQRLLRNQLATTEGAKLRVLHPGFLSREGGPDFRGAVLQFDDAKPVSGDVEVDLHAHGWKGHGHDRNPAFQNVILHVIWDGNRSAGSPPTLTLARRLDASLNELAFWISREPADEIPAAFQGKCCAPFQAMTPTQRKQVLIEAGEIRFRSKAFQFQTRARQTGWEQALWEGVFRALGYKHNSWPMQCLAEARDRWMSAENAVSTLQARLLGIAGLLPNELPRGRSTSEAYWRTAWDQWWREREEFSECALPRHLWRFHGQRPANHPQRRLALAAHWLVRNDFPQAVQNWWLAENDTRNPVPGLMRLLLPQADDFWNWHWTIRSPRLAKPQPLVGAARVTDLAINVFLPWLWIRAFEGGNLQLQKRIESRFRTWPAAEDNAVLKLGRQRLLGGSRDERLETAIEQQGLIQITRDFCDHSNSSCDDCRFPRYLSGRETSRELPVLTA